MSCLSKTTPNNYFIKRWYLLGIPVLFLTSGFMHFIYGLTGNCVLIGIFAPVNESVWEHLKLCFYPIILWFTLGYFINKPYIDSISNWIISCTVSEITCMLTILCFFYTYTGALGIESLFLNVFSLFLALALAQYLSLHIYLKGKFTSWWVYFCILLLIILVFLFTYFTFNPPHIPLFMDGPTGTYGI